MVAQSHNALWLVLGLVWLVLVWLVLVLVLVWLVLGRVTADNAPPPILRHLMRIRFIAFLLTLLLVVAACGGDDTTGTSAPTDTPQSTQGSTEPRATIPATTILTTTTTEPPAGFESPLNGLFVADEDSINRRVMAVKVDNHWNARPQSGLEDADAVYEMLVEAGLTRFIALFLQSDTDYLGPNRSGRPTDPTLLAPLGATFTISGAQAWVQSLIRSLDVHLIGEEPPAAFRVSHRSAPHNLYVDTTLLREIADRRGYEDDPPPRFFDFGPLRGTEPALAITFDWSDDMEDVTWHFDGSGYLRFAGTKPHTVFPDKGDTTTEETITAQTIVVLFADRYSKCPPADQGSCVPAMDTVGSGNAFVFSNGAVAKGTWSRSSTSKVFDLTDASGAALQVPPGKLWVAIFPNGREVTW